jgi:hypothetical protein
MEPSAQTIGRRASTDIFDCPENSNCTSRPGLLLEDRCSISHFNPPANVVRAQLDEVTTAKLAADCQVEDARSRVDPAISWERGSTEGARLKGFQLADEHVLVPRALASVFGACRHAEAFAVPPSTSLGREPFNLLRLSGLVLQNSPSTDRSWRKVAIGICFQKTLRTLHRTWCIRPSLESQVNLALTCQLLRAWALVRRPARLR